MVCSLPEESNIIHLITASTKAKRLSNGEQNLPRAHMLGQPISIANTDSVTRGNNLSNLNASYNENTRNLPDLSDKKPHPTVIGGFAASMAEFPYAVRIYIYVNKILIFCTGEVVHPKLIMTAAHCVELGGSMIAVTGDANQEDYVKGIHIYKYARYRITKVFVHPEFNKAKLIHDVALIKTSRPMLHRGHAIIKVSYVKLTEPVDATIYGWGATEFTKRNHQLYGKHLKAGNCSLKPTLDEKHDYICLLEKGICHGDSGGALIVNGFLCGVASFYKEGNPELHIENRYFYTALSEEKDFVKDCIEKNGSNYNDNFYCTWVFLFYLLIFK